MRHLLEKDNFQKQTSFSVCRFQHMVLSRWFIGTFSPDRTAILLETFMVRNYTRVRVAHNASIEEYIKRKQNQANRIRSQSFLLTDHLYTIHAKTVHESYEVKK